MQVKLSKPSCQVMNLYLTPYVPAPLEKKYQSKVMTVGEYLVSQDAIWCFVSTHRRGGEGRNSSG